MTNLKTNIFCQKKFLSLSAKSKENFLKEFQTYDSTTVRDFYLCLFSEIKNSIINDNLKYFKSLCTLISYVSSVKNSALLKSWYNSDDNALQNTNIVILSCKYVKLNVLKYIFSSETTILSNLTVDIENEQINANEQDDECHNAFYYAIRSGDVDLIDILITGWPQHYFTHHQEQLDALLSEAYEELKLKNVFISDRMEIFIETKLTDLRFFSKKSSKPKLSLKKAEERLDLILDSTSRLKSVYVNEKIGAEFIFLIRFITQNIHVLKQQLRSTYGRLPWEEIEFCLACFISSLTKNQEINLHIHTVLNTDRILFHLQNFVDKLSLEKNNLKKLNASNANVLPSMKRDDVIANISGNVPEFEALYNDYQLIRDVYSLNTIQMYLRTAFSADPKEKKGQILILRALQVTGEHLKNTLESPKLSSSTSDYLIMTAPKNISTTLTSISNMLSSSQAFANRIDIQKYENEQYFIDIHDDMKKIFSSVSDVLHKRNIEMLAKLLQKLIDCKSSEEIFQTIKAGDAFSMDLCQKLIIRSTHFGVEQLERIEKIINELLNNNIVKQIGLSDSLIQVKKIIIFQKDKCKNMEQTYGERYLRVSILIHLCCLNKLDKNSIRGMKYFANCILNDINNDKESYANEDLKLALLSFCTNIPMCLSSSIDADLNADLGRLYCELQHLAEFDIDQIKMVGRLKHLLNKKKSLGAVLQNEQDQLNECLSLLKTFLSNYTQNTDVTSKMSAYRKDNELKSVIEMLLLDTMSLLESTKNCFTYNHTFLDDNSPTLVGRCLRNHLAHGNVLMDVSLSDPSLMTLTNALKTVTENLANGNQKIGRIIREDINNLRQKYSCNASKLNVQDKLFQVLEEGDMENVLYLIKQGADIRARSYDLQTSLHFAARSSNVDIIRFIVQQNVDIDWVDDNKKNVLHVAAEHGRSSVVQYLVEELNISVDSVEKSNRTGLHFAALNGHKDVVKILLENKGNHTFKDSGGNSPLHYAVLENHLDIVKMLLKKETHVDSNETLGGFTSLLIASEKGHLTLVEYLIRNKANVNVRTDKEVTPLHLAALNGHIEVVECLVSHGANINAVNMSGYTPLHNAVENSHLKIIKILLNHDALVNVADFTYKNTPLHYASKDGHVDIVKALLGKRVNVNATTVVGATPLCLAAGRGQTEIISLLIGHGAQINISYNEGLTALHASSFNGHTETVKCLLKAGIKINSVNDRKQTALHMASGMGHDDIVQLLLEEGADVYSACEEGKTALHYSADSNNTRVVQLLLNNGLDINLADNNHNTLLHLAVIKQCSLDFVNFLLQKGASVTIKDTSDLCALHLAVLHGNNQVLKLILDSTVDIDIEANNDCTPLFCAIMVDDINAANMLLKKGAKLKGTNGETLLCIAVRNNSEQFVNLLLKNGVDVDEENGKALSLAVGGGYINIVEKLLNHGCKIDKHCDLPVLHIAATFGYKDIVALLIAKGANPAHRTQPGNMTALFMASAEGHSDVVELLLQTKLNTNVSSIEGTPLHIAAGLGHTKVVEILLKYGAHTNIRDYKYRTALELAVAHNHINIVKVLLDTHNVNTKGADDFSLLHIAAQNGNLEIIKYLIEEGADIFAGNNRDTKPIHIAAREGKTEVVKLFLDKGMSTEVVGLSGQTVLHYTSMYNHLETAKCLLEAKANIDAVDDNGEMPVHIAAVHSNSDIIDFLLENGGVYNFTDKFGRRPVDLVINSSITLKFQATENLFKAVKSNNSSQVEKCIEQGAFINAKNSDRVICLFYACWKGHENVVNILLKNKANPNIRYKNNCTPLHYASKYSHFEIVKSLLSHGAVHNTKTSNFKTPLDFSQNQDVTNLLTLINDSFSNVLNGNSAVINTLRTISDDTILRAVVNACNADGRTLMVSAIHNDYPQINTLNNVFNEKVDKEQFLAEIYCSKEQYSKALIVYREILEKQLKIFAVDHPIILDTQNSIAKMLYKLHDYHKALQLLNEVYKSQVTVLRKECQETLSTKSFIGLVLHRLGKDEEALEDFQQVYKKQVELLGEDHEDTLNTQVHMALVLNILNKFDESLNINQRVYEKRKLINGENSPQTLVCLNNIAMVLNFIERYEEALLTFQTVYEKRKQVLGPFHSDTLRTLCNMANVLSAQGKYNQAMKKYQELYDKQRKHLPTNHLDTVNTQLAMAEQLFKEGKIVQASKLYTEILEKTKSTLGSNHPQVINVRIKLQMIELALKNNDLDLSGVLKQMKNNIHDAAKSGEIETVQYLLDKEVDINIESSEGTTPLHCAVHAGHEDVTTLLLRKGADVTIRTFKGNTVLHTAALQRHVNVTESILRHARNVTGKNFNSFINAQTTNGKSTALHVAVKTGCSEIVKLLLKYGAKSDIIDKTKNVPLHYSKKDDITKLLKSSNQH